MARVLTLAQKIEAQCDRLGIEWPDDLKMRETINQMLTDEEAGDLIAEYGIYAVFSYYSGIASGDLEVRYAVRA